MSEKNIGELVIAARRNDQPAINELYRQTSGKAYFVARRILNDEDQIADILQESYVKAFSRLPTLEDPEKFQGWLDTIVINKCKDYLKKKKPILFTELESEGDTPLDFEDTNVEFSPEASVDYSETKRLVGEMIDRLPEDQKMCLLLYYYEERSVNEIAQMMDCSVNTVKSRLNYARKNIKNQVEELEKKGIKLYCVPFIPFLYWFFRQSLLDSLGGYGTAAMGGAVAGSLSTNTAKQAADSAISGSVTGTVESAAAATTTGSMPASALAKGIAGFSAKKLLIAAAVTIAAGTGGVKAYQHITVTPERTIARFEQAYNDWDLDKMMECMTPEIQDQYRSVRRIAGWFGLDPADLFETVLGINQLSNSEIDLTKMDAEVLDVTYPDKIHAIARVRISYGAHQIEETYIPLEKIDGKWYLMN